MKEVSVTYSRFSSVTTETFIETPGYELRSEDRLARFWGGGRSLLIPMTAIIAIEIKE